MAARFVLLRTEYAHGTYARTRNCAHTLLRGRTRVGMDVRPTLRGSHEVHGERKKHGGAFFWWRIRVRATCTVRAHERAAVQTHCCVDTHVRA